MTFGPIQRGVVGREHASHFFRGTVAKTSPEWSTTSPSRAHRIHNALTVMQRSRRRIIVWNMPSWRHAPKSRHARDLSSKSPTTLSTYSLCCLVPGILSSRICAVQISVEAYRRCLLAYGVPSRLIRAMRLPLSNKNLHAHVFLLRVFIAD
jgi:hypothetical protein